MAYLLDTCVVSEPKQEAPHPNVMGFLRALRPLETFVSSITLAEIWKGIELLRPSKRRSELESWVLTDLLRQVDRRILAVDYAVARQWGTTYARLVRSGHAMPLLDSFLAATALVHGLTLVTRNEHDFVHCGVHILNPWK